MKKIWTRAERRLGQDDMVAMVIAIMALTLLSLALSTIARMTTIGGGSDFQLFRLVGGMAWQGHIGAAYHPAALRVAEVQAFGTPTILSSYAYPPQFDLVAMLLSLGGLAPAYLVFVGGSFAAMAGVLAFWGKRAVAWALFLGFPAILLDVWGGQNGLLTAALIGGFAILFLRGRAVAGIPLGLMVIKPHLAVGLAVLVLARRRFDVAGWALATMVATGLVATLALGAPVWGEFLHAGHMASGMLMGDAFPFFRMVSVYAAARSLGLDSTAALGLQIVGAAFVAVTIFFVARRGGGTQSVVGLGILGSALISPYAYDYDLAVLGLAMMLLTPALRAAGAGWLALSAVLSFATVSWGIGWVSLYTAILHIPMMRLSATDYPTFGGFAGLALFALAAVATLRGFEPAPEKAGGVLAGRWRE